MIKDLYRIETIAKIKRQRNERINNLAKFINVNTLKISNNIQDGSKAIGIDKMSKEEYQIGINNRLEELIIRMKKGSYQPLPVKRVYIPKTNGGQRPLGILTYEDKIVSQVVTEILNQVYDSKFYEFSYGFRPNKSCHKAIRKLIGNIQYNKTNYVFETDIRGCFDNINHEWLIKFLENDIADKKFIEIIKKFIKSGIMDKREIIYTKQGTPQGNQMSPVLANVFLHYVLDNWVEKRFKKTTRGEMNIVRYADDFVCTFQYEEDAIKFSKELKERFDKFGLELAEEKTRLIQFGRYAETNRKNRGEGKPETFDFLGFTFYCSKDSKKQFYRVKVKTSRKRIHKKVKEVKLWLKENRTKKIEEIMSHIRLILIGHYNYLGVTDNTHSICNFLNMIKKLIFKWLNRRSDKTSFKYNEFYLYELVKYKLPTPKIKVNLLTWV